MAGFILTDRHVASGRFPGQCDLEHIDQGQEAFGFAVDVVGEQRMNDALDSASFDQFPGRFLEIAQRLDRYAILVQHLIEDRNRLRLRAHRIDVSGLEEQLVEVFAEVPCLIDELAFGWIEQMPDEFGMVGHNPKEKHVLVNDGVR